MSNEDVERPDLEVDDLEQDDLDQDDLEDQERTEGDVERPVGQAMGAENP